jgi:hypothetical protein
MRLCSQCWYDPRAHCQTGIAQHGVPVHLPYLSEMFEDFSCSKPVHRPLLNVLRHRRPFSFINTPTNVVI